MGRFEQVWAGEREPRLHALPRLTKGDEPEGAKLLRDYGAGLVTKLPSTPTVRQINEVRLRLMERLSLELTLVGSNNDRLAVFEAFAETLRTLLELERDVEPPPYREVVVERVEVPAPPRPKKQKPAGLSFTEEDD